MRIHQASNPRSNGASSPHADKAWVLLLIGIGIGLLWPSVRAALAPPAAQETKDNPTELILRVPVARGPGVDPNSQGPLQRIEVTLERAASERLQHVVERSLAQNQIVQSEGDLVPAVISGDGKRIQAKVRIKGDFVDHIDTPKWSLRVELKGDKLFGMSRFSIQHPKTRSYLWEWLLMQMARREGILTPRSEFVQVVMNGNDMGIYYLEEHFTKELLESQGRREGPIIRFLEDAQLGSEAQYFQKLGYLAPSVAPVLGVGGAEIVAYGEKHLAQSEGLSRQLEGAIALMRGIQEDPDGRRTERLIDVASSARYTALQVLFRCSHGSLWKSRRYYHDPVSARLEPIVFDTGAGQAAIERDPFELLKYALPAYLKNPVFKQALYEELERMVEPGFLDEALAELLPRLQRNERLLRAEGMDTPLLDSALIVSQLREQQLYLREFLHPDQAVGFDCRLLTDDPAGNRPRGDLVVEAWALTEVPVIFEGLTFAGGVFLPVERLDLDGDVQPARTGTGVLLPLDRSRARFTVRNPEREAVLKDVEEFRRAMSKGEARDKSLRAGVKARTRFVGERKGWESELRVRKFGSEWSGEGGRPQPPTLQEALERHVFLERIPGKGGLRVRPGSHQVQGDLVLPDGVELRAGPGVQLAFEEGRGLISSAALRFEGSLESPVRLVPAEGAASWGGVLVIKAEAESRWSHVNVSHTTSFLRSGWMATGGVNFYNSPVQLEDCRFEDALGEDALNIFGVAFVLRRVHMLRVASDAFDGDFVTGEVLDCSFEDSVEDAVDVSGSQISVRDCHFRGIGDKAVSAGERSQVEVRSCVVESASIAIASKDSSSVDVDGLEVGSAANYGFAVYIKKQEFGTSRVVARNVSFGEMGRGQAIVQQGCSLLLNGRNMPGEELDVKQLYRQKVLGQ